MPQTAPGRLSYKLSNLAWPSAHQQTLDAHDVPSDMGDAFAAASSCATAPGSRFDTTLIQPYGCISMQIASPGFDRVFAALADHTRRDIVRRAISAEEGVLELASHYPMSFAAVQKHVAVLEHAGLITKQRIGRRKVVRTNLEALLVARRLLDQYEELWRARIDRMNELIAETARAIDTVETKGSKR